MFWSVHKAIPQHPRPRMSAADVYLRHRYLSFFCMCKKGELRQKVKKKINRNLLTETIVTLVKNFLIAIEIADTKPHMPVTYREMKQTIRSHFLSRVVADG